MKNHDLKPSASSTSEVMKLWSWKRRTPSGLWSTLSTAMKQIEVSIASTVSVFIVENYGLL